MAGRRVALQHRGLPLRIVEVEDMEWNPARPVAVVLVLLQLLTMIPGELVATSGSPNLVIDRFTSGNDGVRLSVTGVNTSARFTIPSTAVVESATVEVQPEPATQAGGFTIGTDEGFRDRQAAADGIVISSGLQLQIDQVSAGETATSGWKGYNATNVSRTPGQGWRLVSATASTTQDDWRAGPGSTAWNSTGYSTGTGVEPTGDGRLRLELGYVPGGKEESMAPRARTAGFWDRLNGRYVIEGGSWIDGVGGGIVYNDTWGFTPSLQRWTRLADGPRRFGHVAVWDWNVDEMVFVGGQSLLFNRTSASGDVWLFNGSGANGTWTKGAAGLPPRVFPSVVWDPVDSRVLVYGGFDAAGNPLNDLWSYDSINDTWTPKGTGPGARARAIATWDYVTSKLVIAGGTVDGTNGLAEVWAWTPAAGPWSQKANAPWTSQFVTGGWGGNGIGLNVFAVMSSSGAATQIWSYAGGNDTWTLRVGNAPPGEDRLLLRQGGIQSWVLTTGVERLSIGCGGCAEPVTNRVLAFNWTALALADLAPVRWWDSPVAWTSTVDRSDGSIRFLQGSTSDVVPSSVWSHDAIGTWSPGDPTPLTYVSTAMTYDDDLQVAYVVGGTEYAGGAKLSAATYRLWDNLTWEGMSDNNVALDGHTLTYASSQKAAFVFGGRCPTCGGTPSDRLMEFEGGINRWRELLHGPGIRADHVGVWDPADSELFILGGNDGASPIQEVWAFSPAANTWRNATAVPAGLGVVLAATWEPAAGTLLVYGDSQQLWSYSPARDVWRQLGTYPFAVDPVNGRADLLAVPPDELVLFNGASANETLRHLLPAYTTDGTMESAIEDAGETVGWTQLSWVSTTSVSGQSVLLQTRSGGTPSPDASWSAWTSPMSAPGPVASPASRYLQFRVALHTPDPRKSPVLESLTITMLRVAPVGTLESSPIDLGAPPRAFQDFGANATAPNSTGVVAEIRTADDVNAAWSDYGNWTTAPARRWVQVRLTLENLASGTTPLLRGWSLAGDAYIANGTYRSLAWTAPYPLVALTVYYKRTGDVRVAISNDGGATWINDPSGVQLFGNAGDRVAFQAVLSRSADGKTGGALENVSLTYKASGFPENLAIGLETTTGGSHHRDVTTFPGTLENDTDPIDFSKQLTELLVLERGQPDVEVAITAATAKRSILTLAALRIVYTVPTPPPVVEVRRGVEVTAPAGTTVDQESFLEYSFVVRNTGNASDRFTIAVASSAGWTATLTSNATTANLTAGSRANVTVQLHVPAVHGAKVADNLTLTATSLGNATVHSSASVRTLALPAKRPVVRDDRGTFALIGVVAITAIAVVVLLLIRRRRPVSPADVPSDGVLPLSPSR